MTRFIKMKCRGSINSFRQPDFHTYHKTLPLPPKTTVAGMLGSALGISPQEVNDGWLKTKRFQVGIVGKAGGKANDLWQIRKYEQKMMKSFQKRESPTPYKTAVIVRELLYHSNFCLYFHFSEVGDYDIALRALHTPAWALSLGREDELVRIEQLGIVDLEEVSGQYFENTVLPHPGDYELEGAYLEKSIGQNLMKSAPVAHRLPVSFSNPGYDREADIFEQYLFVSDFPLKPHTDSKGFIDPVENCVFQLI